MQRGTSTGSIWLWLALGGAAACAETQTAPSAPAGLTPAEVQALKPVQLDRKVGLALATRAVIPRMPVQPRAHEVLTIKAAAKLCVLSSGAVYEVTMVQSTGEPGLDEVLTSTLRGWEHRPYLQDGQPVPFCYVFNYSFTGVGGAAAVPRNL